MEFDSGASYLKRSDWQKAARYLDPIAKGLKEIAGHHGYDFRYDKRWPMVEFSRNRGALTNVYKLSLNSNYMQDGEIFFELFYQQFEKKWLKKRAIKSELISRYSLSDLPLEDRIAQVLSEGEYDRPR